VLRLPAIRDAALSRTGDVDDVLSGGVRDGDSRGGFYWNNRRMVLIGDLAQSVELTPDIARRKAEYLVQLAQMPQPDELSSVAEVSDNESSSISQGVEPLRHVTKNRPTGEKRPPTRRHSASPTNSGAPKSIADGVRTKKKGRSKQKTYHAFPSHNL